MKKKNPHAYVPMDGQDSSPRSLIVILESLKGSVPRFLMIVTLFVFSRLFFKCLSLGIHFAFARSMNQAFGNFWYIFFFKFTDLQITNGVYRR